MANALTRSALDTAGARTVTLAWTILARVAVEARLLGAAVDRLTCLHQHTCTWTVSKALSVGGRDHSLAGVSVPQHYTDNVRIECNLHSRGQETSDSSVKHVGSEAKLIVLKLHAEDEKQECSRPDRTWRFLNHINMYFAFRG